MRSSLYIHVPFCEHKCVYCDFYSIAPNRNGMSDLSGLTVRFLDALDREITMRGSDPSVQGSFDTIFFGGGTPSLLEPVQIRKVLDALEHHFDISADVEITLETNPGTVNRQKLAAFRDAGVNRLSVGIQSFHDDDLRFLTRIHSAEQAQECIANARSAGLTNVSLDLIFSLPGQSLERWRTNLETAVRLQPAHISCYSLIVEPNTPLFRMVETGQVTLLDPDRDAELYEFTIKYLESEGYEQYEVSNFCRPGFRSRHNLRYWEHGNYLGFGPSAHSFWNGRRSWNLANVTGYAERLARGSIPVAGDELLTPDQIRVEDVFLGLRSTGIDLKRWRARYGSELVTEYHPVVERLVQERLATLNENTLRLTPRGYALCDEICTAFMERPSRPELLEVQPFSP